MLPAPSSQVYRNSSTSPSCNTTDPLSVLRISPLMRNSQPDSAPQSNSRTPPMPCTYTPLRPRCTSSANPRSAQTRSSSVNAVSPSSTVTSVGGTSSPSSGTAARSPSSARSSPSRFSQLTVSVAVPTGVPPTDGAFPGRSSRNSAAAAASRRPREMTACFFGIINPSFRNAGPGISTRPPRFSAGKCL